MSERANEASTLADEADLVESEANILLYNGFQMKSQHKYIVEPLLKADYRHGSRFLSQRAAYPVSDATWEPVIVFVHADRKPDERLFYFCLAQASKYNTAMRATRRLRQKYKEEENMEENTFSRPRDEKASSETSVSLHEMLGREPDSRAAPAPPSSHHFEDEERATIKRRRKGAKFMGVERGIISPSENPLGFLFGS